MKHLLFIETKCSVSKIRQLVTTVMSRSFIIHICDILLADQQMAYYTVISR